MKVFCRRTRSVLLTYGAHDFGNIAFSPSKNMVNFEISSCFFGKICYNQFKAHKKCKAGPEWWNTPPPAYGDEPSIRNGLNRALQRPLYFLCRFLYRGRKAIFCGERVRRRVWIGKIRTRRFYVPRSVRARPKKGGTVFPARTRPPGSFFPPSALLGWIGRQAFGGIVRTPPRDENSLRGGVFVRAVLLRVIWRDFREARPFR